MDGRTGKEVKLFFDDRQMAHAPSRELHNGDWVPYAENIERPRSIVEAFSDWRPVSDFGMAPLLAVHDADYLAFLERAHRDWIASGRNGDAIGYTFPITRRRPLSFGRIDADLGAYSYDAGTPIAAGTWQSAYWSAQCALTALDHLATSGETHAFALCRPPGHHAGRDYMGGYCYLNNAAIAAREAQDRGLGPVAILDVDYHHGNGTQDIFYADPDVFFASIHADPRTDYPFYWGHADERGEGAGEGATLNLPLPRRCRHAQQRPDLELRTRTRRLCRAGRAHRVARRAHADRDGRRLRRRRPRQECRCVPLGLRGLTSALGWGAGLTRPTSVIPA